MYPASRTPPAERAYCQFAVSSPTCFAHPLWALLACSQSCYDSPTLTYEIPPGYWCCKNCRTKRVPKQRTLTAWNRELQKLAVAEHGVAQTGGLAW
jgi:hypothetical protein